MHFFIFEIYKYQDHPYTIIKYLNVVEWSKNIDLFQLSATLKQGAPPEVTGTRLPDTPTNDTCCRHIFKELHSTVQQLADVAVIAMLLTQSSESPRSCAPDK